MTEQELRDALEGKGYRYDEATEPQYGYLCVYAMKPTMSNLVGLVGEKRILVGVKDLLLAGSLGFFLQNEAYTKL